MAFKAVEFKRTARAVVVSIMPDGTIQLPAKKRDDGSWYQASLIGHMDAETASDIVQAVQDFYDARKADKAKREAEEAAAAEAEGEGAEQ